MSDLYIMVLHIVKQNSIHSWIFSKSTHFAHSIYSIHVQTEVFPVVFTMHDLQVPCWWPMTGRFFKCLRKNNCQCWRKWMQRLIVFPVPSAALGKPNQNPLRLNAKLDNFDDYSCSISYKIYSSFPQRKSSCNERVLWLHNRFLMLCPVFPTHL